MKPSTATCSASKDKAGFDVTLKLRSWDPKTSSQIKHTGHAVNILTGDFDRFPPDSKFFGYYKEACNGGDLGKEADFEIVANNLGHAHLMTKTVFDVTMAQSQTIGIDLRDDSNKSMICCEFDDSNASDPDDASTD